MPLLLLTRESNVSQALHSQLAILEVGRGHRRFSLADWQFV
jgi:hypothetical protein